MVIRRGSWLDDQANDQGTTLREAALASGYINGQDFDRIVNPAHMVGQ